MTCCDGQHALDLADPNFKDAQQRQELEHAGHLNDDGTIAYVFSVPTVHCGGCISTIERTLRARADVAEARVNLTLRRLNLTLKANGDVLGATNALAKTGFEAKPIDLGDASEAKQSAETNRMLRAVAVAGFAAANIMLLSVSVWSGADGPTRDLFHMISALIAIPAVAYSGQVFFRSAIGALKGGRLNMDVPISLAVILALGLSIFETMNSREEVYFDAAVTLLFFLLIGRTLDQVMRERARNSVVSLSRLSVKGANVVLPDGSINYTPIDDIKPGMVVRVFAGDRLPVDGAVASGTSDVDRSLVTGESEPMSVRHGDVLEAGTVNLTGPLDLRVDKPASQSFLAEMTRMLEAAENGRGHYVRIADRMARIYAPAVHLLALFAFIGWMIATKGDWHTSFMVAIAVLIVTCPCALGLAVPVVHVIGATRLFKEGILMRDGAALERLADVDIAIFDKTGTLTTGVPRVANISSLKPDEAPLLASLASSSSHPASKALAHHLSDIAKASLEDIQEVAGHGVEGCIEGKRVRLGKADWVAEITSNTDNKHQGLSFAVEGNEAAQIELSETIRPDAEKALELLGERHVEAEILSGDNVDAVSALAEKLDVEKAQGAQKPADKFNHLEELKKQGHLPLMVGDGLNDAPSLAAGHASMAPASAADVGRHAADFVFTRDSLLSVPFAQKVAKRAASLVRQNFGLAIIYNCIAVPLALAGFITPLYAAIAMSASSIVVISNSLRLTRGDEMRKLSV